MDETGSNRGRAANPRDEPGRWLEGCLLAAVVVGVLAAAIVRLPREAEANRHACMATHADELHASLAAFGQDPTWQGAFLDALAECSR
ncbi:hypothetical protein [Paraburkholderia sp. J67]|uniref:hypothetical protein n=1 Tax=Paraburkholderia sp. J67 TaxID=2805435 RepID=UPI002ABD918A|nr:hypothetical protein [Paraburkholderia sp. J67]